MSPFLYKISFDIFFPNPSVIFSNIFPTNPSQITTSTLLSNKSSGSILPTKFRELLDSNSNESFISIFPLPSSEPTDNKATLGLSLLNINLET